MNPYDDTKEAKYWVGSHLQGLSKSPLSSTAGFLPETGSDDMNDMEGEKDKQRENNFVKA